MRKLEIAGRKVTVNTDALAKGLYEMHEELDALAPLAFGMLDARIMEMFERNLKEKVHSEYTTDIINSHSFVVKEWLRECEKEVVVKIYGQAKMVV